MIVLGIESSCDETAAAVVHADGTVLSDVVRSQIALHAPYGGVVPEIAARDHVRAVTPVVRQALDDAQLTLAELDGIAVTQRPGLVGALLIGLQAAKGIAWAIGKPLVGVDHLVGHLLSVFWPRTGDEPPVEFPFLGLLVSGGHTALYLCHGPTAPQIQELGATRDDAVGEAFDKVSKLLGLGYPGGPIIDKLAAEGDYQRAGIELKPPMSGSLEFSFSGIKSAVARHVASANAPETDEEVADLCAAFQRVMVRTLVRKTLKAVHQTKVDTVVMAGGVAANRELRQTMAHECVKRNLKLHVPPFRSCTDNAAMIAYAGTIKLANGEHAQLSMGPSPRTELPRLTRKGRGKR